MKTIFFNYLGTLVLPYGPDIEKMINRIIAHSDIKDMDEYLTIWWRLIREQEALHVGNQFLPAEGILRNAFDIVKEQYHLTEDINDLIGMIKNYWKTAQVYPDAQKFIEDCSCPIYICCNIGAPYVAKCLEHWCLRVDGILTGELEHEYKPKPSYYQKALDLLGLNANEVIFIGSEPVSDFEVPRSLGMTAYLVDREGFYAENPDIPEEYRVTDLTTLLHKINREEF